MNILITGAHGFVGTNLVRALKERHVIYGVDIVAPEREGMVNTFGWKDVDKGKIPRVDAIIHLAGKAHDTKNQSESEAYFDINVGLTKKIYDYFLQSQAYKFLFFSSVKAVANRVEGEMLTEEAVPQPQGPYGESKIMAERYIQGRHPAGKSVYILRPCMIHGPGNKGNLNLLYQIVKKGIPWPLGAFENKRTFTSVDNLCFAVEGLLLNDVPSGIYHIADDEALSTNELIGLICEATGHKVRIWHLPKKLMERIASLGSVLHLPLNVERLTKLTENYVVSNAKIKSALGIENMPVRAREGLTKTIRSFQAK